MPASLANSSQGLALLCRVGGGEMSDQNLPVSNDWPGFFFHPLAITLNNACISTREFRGIICP